MVKQDNRNRESLKIIWWLNLGFLIILYMSTCHFWIWKPTLISKYNLMEKY